MSKWRYITELSTPGVDKDRYLVSNNGEIYDSLSKKSLIPFIDNEGYYRINISTINGPKISYLHRLIKIEFDGYDIDINKNVIDHKDCDKSNNDPSNLEWVTSSENALRAIDNGLYPQFNIKLTDEDVEFICKKLKEGLNYKQISDLLFPKLRQDSVRMIGKIYRLERWKHISIKYLPFPEIKKVHVIPCNSILNEEIVEEICMYLSNGHGIAETARYIQTKFSINTDLKNAICFIKNGRTWKHISSKYNLEANNG